MTTQEIIRAWCASMGYPEPRPGDCMALVAVLSTAEPEVPEPPPPLPRIPSEAC